MSSMKSRITIVLFMAAISLSNSAVAQLSNSIIPSLDTLYMPSGSMTPTIDPNPGTNPFLTDSAAAFGRISSMDDPGGPGQGGGGFDPPPDAAIPLDGGVAGLLLTGALLGLKRFKKDKSTV